MSHDLYSFGLPPFSRHPSYALWVVLLVIIFHIGFLVLGSYWTSPSSPKTRPKVIVQTIHLSPFQTTTLDSPSSLPFQQSLATPETMKTSESIKELPSTPSLFIEEDPLPILQLAQEEKLVQEDLSIKVSEETFISPPPLSEFSPKDSLTPISAPLTVPADPVVKPLPKTDSQPQPKTPPKPSVQDIKKPDANKKIEPIKKPVEAIKKKEKNEATKAKPVDEAAKKRHQEQIEAEKKRKQEQAAIENKRKQEQAEAEEAKKRQQAELFAEQEATRQRLAKIKEDLAKAGERRHKINTSPSSNLAQAQIPKELGNLQIDALPIEEGDNTGRWGTKEVSYRDGIAYCLKKGLKLPDYGAVTIKLTLNRAGKVVQVETVKSESSKNKDYIERTLPTFTFPSFGHQFQGSSQLTFLITLHNDS